LKAAPGEAKIAAKTMKGVMQRKINKEKIAERKIKDKVKQIRADSPSG